MGKSSKSSKWNQRHHTRAPLSGEFEVYCQPPNMECTLVGYKIVDHSDAVGVLPAVAASTTSSFST